jgi:voltage-gated sodium channel
MNSDTIVTAVPVRQRLQQFIEHGTVQRMLLALILLNAFTLGLETSNAVMSLAGTAIHLLDKAILAIFVLEILVRLYVHRLAFFKDAWSVFDFVVVGIALLPASGPFSVLRALRVLRVLRVLTFVPSMKKIVGALMQSLNGMLSIAI